MSGVCPGGGFLSFNLTGTLTMVFILLVANVLEDNFKLKVKKPLIQN